MSRTLMIGILAALISCDVFSPREAEPPESASRTDPLNFADILAGTGYQLVNGPYEELVTNDIVYEDMNSGTYFKTQLIQRFQQIRLVDSNVQVTWRRKPGDPMKKGTDTIHFSGLRYAIHRTGAVDGPADDSGSSDMTMARHATSWRICYWRDVPATLDKSYFSP